MGHIMANTSHSTDIFTQPPTTVKQKSSSHFYHHGVQVSSYCLPCELFHPNLSQICLNTFLFLHGIGRRRYDNVRHSLEQFGVQERGHGNRNRLSHNGFTTPELKTIVCFLKNYSEENAILLPGRIPGYKRTDLQLLPTNTTKKEIWKCYIKACASLTFRAASYQSFCKIWKKYTPQILITTPKTDLCWICQQNSFAITASSNKTDVEKERV